MALFPDKTLVHHWRLNDTTGLDTGYNPVPLSVLAGVVMGQTGKIDKCMQFNGTTTSYAIIGSATADMNTKTNFAIAFWLKYGAGNAQPDGIFACGYDTTKGFNIGFGAVNKVFFENRDATTSGSLYTGSSLTVGTWAHLAFSLQKSIGTWYLNGTASASGVIPMVDNSGTSFMMGARPGIAQPFAGAIEDVRWYTRAITGDEALALYNSGAGTYKDLAVSGTTAWSGESLYQYDSSSGSWNKAMDLTPLHHWRLNDATITANDAGSFPRAGTFASCILSQPGIAGLSTRLTGTLSYVITPSGGPINKYCTFMAWAKEATTISTNQYLGSSDNGTVAFGYHADSTQTTGLIIGSAWVTMTTRVPTANQFNHICYVLEDSSTSVYVNGVFGDTRTGITPPTILSSEGLHIGSNYIGTGNFNGYIEDVRIYNRCLAPQEILAIYNKGKGTYSHSLIQGYPTVKPPLHHWRLNELMGTVCNDSGSSPFDGSSTSCILSATGQFDTCYAFTGSASYIAIPIKQNSFTALSFSLWTKATANGANSYIFRMQDPAVAHGMAINLSVSTLYYSVGTGGANVFMSANITINTWQHVTMVLGGGSFTGYLNASPITTVASTHIINSTTQICIACASTLASLYTGNVQDLRMYDYALSKQEIQNIYNNGKGTHL